MNVPIGRPIGTTREAGSNTSTGHPSADVDIEMKVPIGRPVGTTGEAGFNTSTGHPTADVDIEMNVAIGRPIGTTGEAGFNESLGCSSITSSSSVEKICNIYAEDADLFIEDNLSLLIEYNYYEAV